MDDTTVDAKPWYLSKTILAGIVGTVLSALSAFHILLPAYVTADSVTDFLITGLPFLLMIAAHWKSTAVVTTTQAKADVINAAATAPVTIDGKPVVLDKPAV